MVIARITKLNGEHLNLARLNAVHQELLTQISEGRQKGGKGERNDVKRDGSKGILHSQSQVVNLKFVNIKSPNPF